MWEDNMALERKPSRSPAARCEGSAQLVDGADAPRRSIGLRITIRFMSGTSRRPSSG